MNPLFSIFIVSLFIDDYFFKEGKYIKIYIISLVLYLIFYYLQTQSSYYTSTRKLNMAAYNQSFDPTVYAKVMYDLKNVRTFLKKLSEEKKKHISLTIFLVKMIGEVFAQFPECNEYIRLGLKHKRNQVDINIILSVGKDKHIDSHTFRDVPNKTFVELEEEYRREIENLNKKSSSKVLTFREKVIQYLPSYIYDVILDIHTNLSSFGINLPLLGIEHNQYGSVQFATIGHLNLKDVYLPLRAPTSTSGIFLACSAFKKIIVNPDGTTTEKELLPMNYTIDHRYIDGFLSSKMVVYSQKCVQDPNIIKVI